MKQLLGRLNNFGFTPRSTVWFLLFIAALTYGLFFWQRGFYWDEFPWAWIYFRLGPDMLTKTSHQSPILGDDLSGHAADDRSLSVGVAVAGNCAALGDGGSIVENPARALPRAPETRVLGKPLFPCVPGMGQQFISMMYSHFYIVLSAFLLSLYLSVLALKSEKYRLVLFAASYLLAVGQPVDDGILLLP
jgi:hypothetical protein